MDKEEQVYCHECNNKITHNDYCINLGFGFLCERCVYKIEMKGGLKE